MFDSALTLTIEGLFTIVFVATLVQYVRRRDALSRDLFAVFGSIAALFVVQFVALVFGSSPGWLSAIAAGLIFAQPLLTLRLAGRLRPVPPIVSRLAVLAYLVSGVPL